MRKKKIIIIFTGGTISMHRLTDSSKTTLINNHDELLNSLKMHLSHFDLEGRLFSMKSSPALDFSDLFSLAKLTKSYIENPLYDGIVITHGTDTLEETAYFLDLVNIHTKPIVLTGSMRSYSELGYDGLSNLVSSILVAANPQSKKRGTLIVLNDAINEPSETTKSHTLALDTFKSLEFGPLGIIDEQNVIYYRETKKTPIKFNFAKLTNLVEIVKVSFGMSPMLLDLLIDNGIKGIVLESMGRGNVPPTLTNSIKRAIQNNIPVVLTSRCPMGRVVDTYGYEGGGAHLKSLGVIFAPNLNSQKARIKLILAMTTTNKLNDIDILFQTK